jgi:hypothetical protein
VLQLSCKFEYGYNLRKFGCKYAPDFHVGCGWGGVYTDEHTFVYSAGLGGHLIEQLST